MADRIPQGTPQDRYVVQEYLSEGGMGAIYIGKKLGAGGFSKAVVLKQLLPEFTSQREFRELFLREARLSATLDHANIVHTIDLVNAAEDFFIVMEYLPGADLRTMLKKAKRRQRRFSPAAGIYVTRELLSALSYAHNKRSLEGKPLNLIHRDVSPSNILVSHNGEVKLTDFGIAKASTHNSVLYRVKGKVGYMSPEQAKSEDMDHRSDLYSLAVCLFEMVAGERLFVKAGLSTSAEEMYSRPVPLLSRTMQGVPPEFDKLMLKALHIDPDHRYQTASSFQDALLRCAHRAGLMMSTPELAAHLRDVCGDPSEWRDFDSDDDDDVPADDGSRPGTEVYESEDGGGLRRSGDISDLDLLSVDRQDEGAGAAVVDARAQRDKRSRSSLFALDRLRGMELTSLIDLSRQRQDGGPKRRPSGSRPLVDVADFGFADMAQQPSHDRGGPAPGLPGMGPPGSPEIQPLHEQLEPSLDMPMPMPAPAAYGHQVAPGQPGQYRGQPGQHGGQPGQPAQHRADWYPAHPAAHPHVPDPGSSATGVAWATMPSRRRRISPVVVIILLIVIVGLGIAAAAFIGLSGPSMGEGELAPTDTSADTPGDTPADTPADTSGDRATDDKSP